MKSSPKNPETPRYAAISLAASANSGLSMRRTTLAGQSGPSQEKASTLTAP